MAELGKASYPFVAFQFEVRVDQIPVGGFTECQGLALETEVHDVVEGGENTYVRKLPGRIRQTNITLRRGVADRVLWDWHAQLGRGVVRRRGGSVLLRHPGDRDVLAEWQFTRAFPVRWVGPELDATRGQVAVESIELAHEGLDRRR